MTKKIFAALIALIICLSAVISASAYTQEYVIDYADKLSSGELEELNLFAEKLETAYGVAVLFCITEGTGDVTADEFASETYSDYTDNENGIIIVHDDWNNAYCVFTSGNAEETFTNAAVDSMNDAYDLNESYYGGIYACYNLAMEYLENGYSGGYVYESEEFVYAGESDEPKTENEKDGVSIIWLPVSLLIGLLVGFIIINSVASKNKSVKMQENATVYTRPGSMVITGSADNFLYKNLDRTEKPKQTENQNK
ncbi:MAG: TPM domain-containing protein [Ruminococcaceae bacterium]|nr:TPM domain-containing protein [Oscillospiraceae bacterium]